MIKRRGLTALFLIIFIVALGFSSASFEYLGNSLETLYYAGGEIKGSVNLTLEDEPTDSLFTSNFEGEIELLELLNENGFVEGVDYDCNYDSCADSHIAKGAITELSVSESGPGYFGFELSIGEDVYVTDINISLTSDSGESCSRQFIIDVLDDEKSFIQNSKNSGIPCGSEDRGCFTKGLSSSIEALVTSSSRCENISLGIAPGHELGAYVERGSGASNLIMEIYDGGGNYINECELPDFTVSVGDSERLECSVNHSTPVKESFLVCIKAEDDSSSHKIELEQEEPICGSTDNGLTYTADFDVFAKPLRFAAPGVVDINEESFAEQNSGDSLVNSINWYIDDRYGGDCSDGCVIPFKIEGVDQTVNFVSAELEYSATGLGTLSVTGLKKLEKEKAEITSKSVLKIDVGAAGFEIPIDSEEDELDLYLGGEDILPSSLDISILPSFDFDLSPKTVLIGPTEELYVVTTKDISSAYWEFGDGKSANSSGKRITHRFTSQQDSFTIDVELTGSDGSRSKRSFEVTTGSLNESANRLLREYSSAIDNITARLNGFDSFVRIAIESKLGVADMRDSLDVVKEMFLSATTEEGYSAVITDALAINPPSYLIIEEEGRAIPLSTGIDSADTVPIEQISGSSVSSGGRDDLKKSIFAWMDSNYQSSFNYKIISAGYDGVVEPLVTEVRLSLVETGVVDEAYLVINYPRESIEFDANYSLGVVGSAVHMPISAGRNIGFSIDGAIRPSDLGMYISPKIDQLGGYEEFDIVRPAKFRLGLFLFWLAIVLMIAFIAYIIMQEWYKRKYESYLFKNPVDLYNVINFIHNSRKKEKSDVEISKKLKEAKWNNEQIVYAFRKLDGKRTGMFEIPIFRPFEKMKIKAEVEKRAAAQKAGPGPIRK